MMDDRRWQTVQCCRPRRPRSHQHSDPTPGSSPWLQPMRRGFSPHMSIRVTLLEPESTNWRVFFLKVHSLPPRRRWHIRNNSLENSHPRQSWVLLWRLSTSRHERGPPTDPRVSIPKRRGPTAEWSGLVLSLSRERRLFLLYRCSRSLGRTDVHTPAAADPIPWPTAPDCRHTVEQEDQY